MTTYTTKTDLYEHEVDAAINSGDATTADFDMDALYEALDPYINFDEARQEFAIDIDHDAFWGIVMEHIREA